MTVADNRLISLDSLRGLAVLGILVVNIMAFAWPMTVAMDATAGPFAIDGMLSGNDRLFYWVEQTFFVDRFRNLFTLLFGVSLFLVGGERTDKDRGRLLRRRLGWLAVFGLVHGLLIWFGDILLFYAFCGLFAMLARSLSGRILIIIGGGITAALGFCQLGFGLLLPMLPPEFSASMSGEQTADVFGSVTDIIAAYQSGLVGALIENLKAWLIVQLSSLMIMPFSSIPIMLLGMGLFKVGFFHGRVRAWIYWALIAVTAVALAARGWAVHVESLVPPVEMPSRGLDEATAGLSVLITIGYAALVIMVPVMFRWLAPVGQMAFTTYLCQSLIMAFAFYAPFGPKLFGTVPPGQMWTWIIGCWIAQIVFAHVWMRFFRWGPLEWVWRCLTYGRKLEIRKSLP
ncbi:DUF418 domain-containing protein [uncultured Brevundimonas sp.]|uniref:DUF418 domain-containing protein n=1 Tax=uncultured Brevundimonas sp. TaxID=213418 RepID=UPI00260CA9CE|nr:DUF418 domain-containing protein [uncultured Brevundimonas sp.]